jgi:Na+-translocating ferredoxin:NAD+ oxidoreductase RnfD subunit
MNSDQIDIQRQDDTLRYRLLTPLPMFVCLFTAASQLGGRVWLVALLALIGALGVELSFAAVRKSLPGGGSLVLAGLLALMLPVDLPWWMPLLAGAFGAFFGREVFGGMGDNVFNPVMVAKAFLIFSFPQNTGLVKGAYFGSCMGLAENPDAWVICSGITLLGGLVMLMVSWSNLYTMSGIMIAALCVASGIGPLGLLPYDTTLQMLVSDGLLFSVCFLACDPGSSPQNRYAKFMYGLLVGTCVVLMRSFSNYTEAMMSAVLMGNLFAPMLDILATPKTEAKAS